MEGVLSFVSRNKLFVATILLIMFWCSQKNQGWMMVVLAPAVMVYQLGKLGLFWKNRLQRHDRYLALAVIAVSILVVTGSHRYHHVAARSAANRIVADILNFRKNFGRYPVDEIELRVSTVQRKRLYRLKYQNFAGKPVFSYSGTFGLFHKWEYDFSAGVWNYESE